MDFKSKKKFDLNFTDLSNFHPLEVVGRSSDTQLQVSEIEQ